MAVWHLRSKRKLTGGKLRKVRKKRKLDGGSKFLDTRIAEKKIKIKRVYGGKKKVTLLSSDKISVSDPKTGRIQHIKLISVEENPANPHYARRNIITKGAIVKTEAGMARITNRPTQDGVVSGVLIGEKK